MLQLLRLAVAVAELLGRLCR